MKQSSQHLIYSQYENTCHAEAMKCASEMWGYDFVTVYDSSWKNDPCRSVEIALDMIHAPKDCTPYFRIMVPNSLEDNECHEEFDSFHVCFYDAEGFWHEVKNKKGEDCFDMAREAVQACQEYFEANFKNA